MAALHNYRTMITVLLLNLRVTGPTALNGAFGQNTRSPTESHSAEKPLSSKTGRKLRTSSPSCQIFSQRNRHLPKYSGVPPKLAAKRYRGCSAATAFDSVKFAMRLPSTVILCAPAANEA